MMSLSKPTAGYIIKQQFRYKVEAYLDQFLYLVMLQVLALLFSFSSSNSMGYGSDSVFVHVGYYSVNMVLIFTMLWGLVTGVYLTTKNYRYDDFSFVTNRMTSNVSNSLILVFASIFAGVTAMLTSFLQKVLLYFFSSENFLMNFDLMEYFEEMLIGITAAIFHVLFLAAIGYFIGTLVQLNKIFVVVIPAIFILMLNYFEDFTSDIFFFYYAESSLLIFSLKIIITSLLLFASATVLSNRLEVSK